jgi:hypothetical protein
MESVTCIFTACEGYLVKGPKIVKCMKCMRGPWFAKPLKATEHCTNIDPTVCGMPENQRGTHSSCISCVDYRGKPLKATEHCTYIDPTFCVMSENQRGVHGTCLDCECYTSKPEILKTGSEKAAEKTVKREDLHSPRCPRCGAIIAVVAGRMTDLLCVTCLREVNDKAKTSSERAEEPSEVFLVNLAAVEELEAKHGSALDTQVGGDHYKDYAIQPKVFFILNQIPGHKTSICERILRYDHPTGKGREDLMKIKHEVDLILEIDPAVKRD